MPDLNHTEVERRFTESLRTTQIYLLLHLRPGSTVEQISQILNVNSEGVLDSLGDLYWGGLIVQDNSGFYPAPIFLGLPFGPLFWLRQLSKD